jgi:predicted DCC family thiol-disulfide oxidoreductase YuxK
MGAVILFDGICNFCDSSVNLIIKHDDAGYFKFAPLQSEIAGKLLAETGIENVDADSIILIEDEQVYMYSTAALRIARRLGGIWSLLYVFIIVPKFIRDFIYKLFAKYRYKLFGKKDECMIPTPEIRQRFLSSGRNCEGENEKSFMGLLKVGVDSWIIQDGNYDDFKVGQEARFALEFSPISLKSSNCESHSAAELTGSRYKIRAQVIFCTEEVSVLDFGFLAFFESKPLAFAAKGSWVEGEIYLGIDPFFYSAYLNKIPNMPALTYNFRIEKIFLNTTPWIEKSDEAIGRTILMRDVEKESFREVTRTNAWMDDDQAAHYVLECLPIR